MVETPIVGGDNNKGLESFSRVELSREKQHAAEREFHLAFDDSLCGMFPITVPKELPWLVGAQQYAFGCSCMTMTVMSDTCLL